MAASTTLLNATDLLLKVGGNTVGCETSSTLRLNRENRGAAGKCTPQWVQTVAAQTGWGIDFDSLYLESSAVLGSDDVALTIGGTALKGVKQIDIALNAELFDTVNRTTGLTPSRAVDARSVQITVEADYYDPAGTGADALGTAIDEVIGTTTTAAGLAVALTVGDVDVSGNFRPSDVQINPSKPGFTSVSLTLDSTGSVTNATTNADTGFAALLSAFFDASGVQSVTALFTTATTDNTEWTGTTFPSSLSIGIPFPGEVTVSGSLEGSGALTEQASS